MNTSQRRVELHHAVHRQPDAEEDTSTTSSASSSYKDQSTNDLSLISGAALITADCLGTGILALPADVAILGAMLGLGFIVLNLPINLYAGTILGRSAGAVESKLHAAHGGLDDGDAPYEFPNDANEKGYSSIRPDEMQPPIIVETHKNGEGTPLISSGDASHHQHHHVDTATFDFIGMTSVLFTPSTKRQSHPHGLSYSHLATKLVLALYYTNIFLVLGNYILVMSHAVAAMVGEENIRLPMAGIVASMLMYSVSQLRTMANLGRSASVVSLTALAIVVLQCIWGVQHHQIGYISGDAAESDGEYSIIRKLAAASSIGFAVGSQKLFLNIRHEMKVREEAAPGSLGISLFVFGAAYVSVCLLSGPNPPSFLFDAIGAGISRRIAGFLLWVHVAVSFAINSQALCSSIDRIAFHRVTAYELDIRHRTRWAVLTLLVAVLSYTVANVVPFFRDLVALIGALTSVPLTLLLPAVFYRKVNQFPIFLPTSGSVVSYVLLVFSIVFLVCGLFGALGSVEFDWKQALAK